MARNDSELDKKPLRCLEYVVVHEMIYLSERRHNDQFRGILDQVIPDWRMRLGELDRS